MSIYSKWHNSMVLYYQSIKEKYSAKYMREAFIGTLLLVCLGGGYFLNKFYVQNREQLAFVDLSEVIDSFMLSQQQVQSLDQQKDKEKIEQAWSDTQILVDALYQKNINSYLAPYFLVFKSQIVLERDHDLDQAIKILDDALKNISKNNELGSLYHMKRIKMGFDSKDQEIKNKALADLIAFTQDEKSYAYQEALYLLGVYYLSINDATKAQEAFQKLDDSSDKTALLKSPWVILAEEKLGLVPKTDAE